MNAIGGGGGNLGLPADGKHQITISGSISKNLNCFASLSDIHIEIKGPLPSRSYACGAQPNEDSSFRVICETGAGVYAVELMNSRNRKVITTMTLNASHIDRFDIALDACSK